MHTVLNSFEYNEDAPSCISCSVTGKHLGYKRKDGYWVLSHRGKQWLAHRIVWGIHNGPIETSMCTVIDHIDRDRGNNSLLNLRLVSQSVNAENKGVQSNNKAGYKYINVCGRTGNYTVRIRRATYGTYSDVNDALSVRDDICAMLGMRTE